MKSTRVLGTFLLTLGLCAVAAVASADGVLAGATFTGCTDPAVTGFAKIFERPSNQGVKTLDILVVIRGLPDGEHAVHIHETGACTPCGAANGHFDPGPFGNSSPDGNHPFHSGDLVNVNVIDGLGILLTTSTRVTLSPGPLSVFDADGSAIIIHVSPDTYCPAGPVAGCAGGARAACGILQPM